MIFFPHRLVVNLSLRSTVCSLCLGSVHFIAKWEMSHHIKSTCGVTSSVLDQRYKGRGERWSSQVEECHLETKGRNVIKFSGNLKNGNLSNSRVEVGRIGKGSKHHLPFCWLCYSEGEWWSLSDSSTQTRGRVWSRLCLEIYIYVYSYSYMHIRMLMEKKLRIWKSKEKYMGGIGERNGKGKWCNHIYYNLRNKSKKKEIGHSWGYLSQMSVGWDLYNMESK